jgi:hypothetical protein
MRALCAQKAGAPILAHRTRNNRCPVCTGHPGGPRSQKLQRSESNGSDDVAGALDMSGVHRTVRCALEQTASQRPLLVVGAINTPTTPKRSNPLQIPHNAIVTRESDLLVFFRALALGLLSSFLILSLRSNSLVIEARDTKLVVVLVGTLCSK